ncbi:MAG: branched-chain amino acid ABC transporter permease [Curvibacter lanceolatus]|uniref:branched-chain amino acid ABC transporter permease n=1 Tax=Curvibacter lanceolatus TaxID=86182 RepID=UPI0004CF86D9|nr:branched-chain amino acid ABC transporter permease [Curvibacter lanceolatus]MBV5291714.1 branched-chain amino acid ABC transporter permease [Curvibacter lanceolatus]
MNNWIELLINGLLLGSLYALFALGLSLSLGVMKMINLAHGDLIVLGAYVAWTVMEATGWPALVCLAVVLPLMFCIGWLLQAVLLNRVVGAHELSPLLVTFGLSVVIQNLLLEVFSADTRNLPSGDLTLRGLDLGGVSVGVFPLLIGAVSVLMYAVMHLLVAHTHGGRQARAVSDDAPTARLVGVDDKRFFALMAGLVMVVTALAAVLYGMRTPFAPMAGPERLLFAFEAVVMGGLGHLWGSFFGGLLIGLAHVLGAQVNPGLGAFFGHLTFLVVLLVRPQGLFRPFTHKH